MAVNAVDQSVQSAPLLVIAARVPTTPDAPTKKSASSLQITIEWVKPDTRGSEIIEYEVHWNEGGSGETYQVLNTVDASVTEYQHLSTDPGGLSAGEIYKFKVLARNAVGPSLLSPSTTIKAATVPDAPAKPTLVD